MSTPNRLNPLLEKIRREINRIAIKISKDKLNAVVTATVGTKTGKPESGKNIDVQTLPKYLRSYDADYHPSHLKIEFFEDNNTKVVGMCEHWFTDEAVPIQGKVISRDVLQETNGFSGGLGGIDKEELNGFIDRKVTATVDELRRRDKEEQTLKELESVKAERDAHAKKIEDFEAREAARDKLKEYAQLAGHIGPVLGSLIGGHTPLGKALAGLGGIPDGNDLEGAAATIPDIIHDFISKLEATGQEALLQLFQLIDGNRSLIPQLLATAQKILNQQQNGTTQQAGAHAA